MGTRIRRSTRWGLSGLLIALLAMVSASGLSAQTMKLQSISGGGSVIDGFCFQVDAKDSIEIKRVGALFYTNNNVNNTISIAVYYKHGDIATTTATPSSTWTKAFDWTGKVAQRYSQWYELPVDMDVIVKSGESITIAIMGDGAPHRTVHGSMTPTTFTNASATLDCNGMQVNYTASNGSFTFSTTKNKARVSCSFELAGSEWTGTHSSSWDDPDNWDRDEVPAPDENIVVPDGVANPPMLVDGLSMESLTIEDGAEVEFAENAQITISDDLIIEGSAEVIGAQGAKILVGGDVEFASAATYSPNGMTIELNASHDQSITTGGLDVGNITINNNGNLVTVIDEWDRLNTGLLTLEENAQLTFSHPDINFENGSIDNRGLILMGFDGGGTAATIQTIWVDGQNLGNLHLEVPNALDEIQFTGEMGVHNATLIGDGEIRIDSDLEVTGTFSFEMGGVATLDGDLGKIQFDNADITGAASITGTGTLNVDRGVYLRSFEHNAEGIIDIGAGSVSIPTLESFRVVDSVRFIAPLASAQIDIRLSIGLTDQASYLFNTAADVRFSPALLSPLNAIGDFEMTGTGTVVINGGLNVVNSFLYDTNSPLSVSGPIFSLNNATIRGNGAINSTSITNGFSGITELFGSTSILASNGTTQLDGLWLDHASNGVAQLGGILIDDGAEAHIRNPNRKLRVNTLNLFSNGAPTLLEVEGLIECRGDLSIEEGATLRMLQTSDIQMLPPFGAPQALISGFLQTEIGPVKPRLSGPADPANYLTIDFIDDINTPNLFPALEVQGLILENIGRSGGAFGMRIGAGTNVLALNDLEVLSTSDVSDALVFESDKMPNTISNLYMEGSAAKNINANALSDMRIDIGEATPNSGTLYGGGDERDDNNVLFWENPPVVAILGDSVLPNALVENPYSGGLSAIGGNEPWTWSLSNAPDFLSINPVNGEISGTPERDDVGIVTFAIVVSDSSLIPETASKVVTLAIDALENVSLTIVTNALPDARVDKLYGHSLSVVGGDGGPYTWALVGGELPDGVALGEDGLLQGLPLPSAIGLHQLTFRASDRLGQARLKVLTLRVQSDLLDEGQAPSDLLNDGPGGGGCSLDSGVNLSWLVMLMIGALFALIYRRRTA